MKRLAAYLAVLCLLCGLFLAGCGDDGTGRSFRFPLEGEPKQLDPQAAADAPSATLLAVLFEGLTRLDEAGQAVPGAATWTVSPDGLTYTFTLKESYWSTLSLRRKETPWDEPTPVTAADFVFGLQRAVDPATAAPKRALLDGILRARDIREGKAAPEELGVHATGDRELVIVLAAPDPAFPQKLAAAPCMPCNREFFAYTAGRYGLESTYLLCNGPFRLGLWSHGESLLLYKNEGYHDAARIAPEAVRYVINPTDAAHLLQTGGLDAAPLTDPEAAVKAGIQTVKLEDRLRSVYFNTAATPLSSLSLRQALRDSIEWQTVYAHLTAAGEPAATGYVTPAATLSGGDVYRRTDNARAFATDIPGAQAALGRALQELYPDKTAPTPPRLTVLAAEDAVSADLARYLIQSWQKHLKLYADLELVSESTLEARLKSGNYQIAIRTATATGLTGAENLQCYTSGGVGNVTRYASTAVDTAAAKALQGGRSELQALESLLAAECPTLPLSFPPRYVGIAPGSEGILVRPFDGGTYGATLEFLNARKWD